MWLSFFSPFSGGVIAIFGIAIYSMLNSYWIVSLVILGGAIAVLWLRYCYLKEGSIYWVRSPERNDKNDGKKLEDLLPSSAEEVLTIDEANQAASMIKLYQELKLANQDIEIFLYKAYHNFLGPIATIRGVCNVAMLEGQQQNAPAYFNQVKQVAESMQAMLEKLLQISIIHNHEIDIQAVTLSSFFKEYQIKQPHTPESIQAHLRASTLNGTTVQVDTFLLTTIIERIITNAHRFRQSSPHTLAEIFVEYQETASHYVICLKEFGLGLPDDMIDHLFKMFHRSSIKPDDHGLGFYAARYAARRMGGDITIEPGGGHITFCIRLPRENCPKPKAGVTNKKLK
ncbi:sensor histidine kinase [Tunicatimonas pelagia]|uniref:sensor histidine kinase n=1 Tax=Tunicatimonas pelagia TaxID=931531 RepID=UPI002665DA27|nr:HAMP domain-containing sensor histidine kinase [Tunicatimonas pelagia]WKN44762.1 HAMP domain-containing sensor histidine kinase [Tunicatimonas pelagia]